MSSANRSQFDVVVVAAASFLQILIQFGFQVFMAGKFAATAESDAYYAALILPMTLAAIATGSLTYVLVPELVKRFEAKPDEDGWQLASLSGLATFLVGLIGSLVIYSAAEPICDLLGFERKETPGLLKILSWQVLLTSLITWGTAVHHGRHKFFAPALGGVLGTGAMLVLVIQFGAILGLEGVAWTMNMGSAISVFVSTVTLLPNLVWPAGQREVGTRMLWQLGPLVAGAVILRFDPVVDRVLAERLAEEFGDGQTAYIHHAQRILMALITIGTSSLAIIAFPRLANAVRERAEFVKEFSIAMRRTLLVIIPICFGLAVFSPEIIKDLLQRGNWNAQDTEQLASLIVTMLGMFAGASIGEILARAFYVQGDTRTPTIVGACALCVGLIAKFSLYMPLGIHGIGLGMSLYYLLSAGVMAILLLRIYGWQAFMELPGSTVQAVVAAVGACGCSYVIYAIGVGRTWLAGQVGVVSFFGILLLLRNQDALLAVNVTVNRILRREKSG